MEQNPAVKEIADAARNNVGGINLSDEHLTMHIKVEGQGMPLRLSSRTDHVEF